MGNFDTNFFDHLVMFIIAIVMPGLAIISARQSLEGIVIDKEMKKKVYLGNSLFLWIGAIVVIALWVISFRNLKNLGFQFTMGDQQFLSLSLTVLFLLLYILDVFNSFYPPSKRIESIKHWEKRTPFLPVNKKEFNWYLILAFSAGICEEIIYRAYMINYLMSVLKHHSEVLILSVMLPALVFGVAHYYQGKKAVLKVILMAMLFGYIYILTQSILLLILMHIAVDIFGGILSVYMMSKSKKVQD